MPALIPGHYLILHGHSELNKYPSMFTIHDMHIYTNASGISVTARRQFSGYLDELVGKL